MRKFPERLATAAFESLRINGNLLICTSSAVQATAIQWQLGLTSVQ